jgi:hypothetical protein
VYRASAKVPLFYLFSPPTYAAIGTSISEHAQNHACSAVEASTHDYGDLHSNNGNVATPPLTICESPKNMRTASEDGQYPRRG